ncbi:MAG: selenoneine biosynthesis selenosugar synthase SenB [Thermoanaerobaculia bacterium]
MRLFYVQMRIVMTCPAPPGSRLGNRITASRWRGILRSLGHDVRIVDQFRRGPADLLIALHARRSAPSVERFAERMPGKPIVVALTGTDLYRDIHTDASAQRSLQLADALVVLQPAGIEALPPSVRPKSRVIRQSAKLAHERRRSTRNHLDFAFAAHVRPEKDPLTLIRALSLLPTESKIRVLHAGRSLDDQLMQQLIAAESSRYVWLGELSQWKSRRLIASCHGLVLTSLMEGGANVLSEAIVAKTPILSSRIDSSVAILGRDYPGFFEVRDAEGLKNALLRFEMEPEYRARLETHVEKLAPEVRPQREAESWRELLATLTDSL